MKTLRHLCIVQETALVATLAIVLTALAFGGGILVTTSRHVWRALVSVPASEALGPVAASEALGRATCAQVLASTGEQARIYLAWVELYARLMVAHDMPHGLDADAVVTASRSGMIDQCEAHPTWPLEHAALVAAEAAEAHQPAPQFDPDNLLRR